MKLSQKSVQSCPPQGCFYSPWVTSAISPELSTSLSLKKLFAFDSNTGEMIVHVKALGLNCMAWLWQQCGFVLFAMCWVFFLLGLKMRFKKFCFKKQIWIKSLKGKNNPSKPLTKVIPLPACHVSLTGMFWLMVYCNFKNLLCKKDFLHFYAKEVS